MWYVFVAPAVLSLAICLVPVWLLRRHEYRRAQDYFVSSQSTPPDVVRNSSVASALRLAILGPFFAWGASGDFVPAVIGAVCFGAGLYLFDVFRGPILDFLDAALGRDGSITVHEFIARRNGNDPWVRLTAASLTIFALSGLVVAEAVALGAVLRPLVAGSTAVSVSVTGVLIASALYAALSGNSGAMQSGQLQLGMIYLGLFGATVMLLYLLVSAVTAIPPYGTFAIVAVVALCTFIACYRLSKYVDTTLIRVVNSGAEGPAEPGRPSLGARLLRRFEQVLNICVSLFALWIFDLACLEFYARGVPTIARDSFAALQEQTQVSPLAFVALALLPLFYPLVDVRNWQRIAAAEKERDPSTNQRRRWYVRRCLRKYAIEAPLLWLFASMFGAIAMVAVAIPDAADSIQAFITQLVADKSLFTTGALSLLLVGVLAIASATISSSFSAGLCTIRYDILPVVWPQLAAEDPSREPLAGRATLLAGGGLFIAIIAAAIIADCLVSTSVASGTFLAVLFVLCCAQLALAPLVFAPLIGRASEGTDTLSPRWALAVLGTGAGSTAGVVMIYAVTGTEGWLWAAVPACLASGLFVLILGRLRAGRAFRAT
jgi:hypothetical protein